MKGQNDDIDLRADDALWDLLGRARSVEASPFFVRKVFRALAEEGSPTDSLWQRWLRLIVPLGACAAIMLAAFSGLQVERISPTVAELDSTLEFDTIANLDVLSSNYESSIWLDGYASLPPY